MRNFKQVVASVFTLNLALCLALPVVAATRFTYAHSGEAASGVLVIFQAPGQPEKRLAADEHGDVPTIPPGSDVVVRDRRTKVTLLMIAHGEPIPERIETPELIRLSGTVADGSAAGGGLIVQYGYGKRVTAIDRLQRNYERYSTLRGSNTFFGIELPKAPLFWANATVQPDGRFTTNWFPAVDDPLIVAHNSERAIGIRDFTLPRTFATGQTFTLDPVTLSPTRSLALDYQAPTQPAGAQASAVQMQDVRLTLTNAQITPEDRSSVARLLSVLDYIDPKLFVFAAGLGPYDIEPGASVIAGLPQFGQLQVRAKGALTPHAVDRTLGFTGDRANLGLSSADLVPPNETAQFKGLVALEHSYLPVKDAKVVFRCSAKNIETATNEDGEFGIPNACAGRNITFFVTARDWMQPPRFQPVQLRKTIQPKSAAEPVVIAIPATELPPPTPKPGTPPPPPREDRPSPGQRQPARLVPLMSSPLAAAFRGRAVPPDAGVLDDSQYWEDGPIVYVYTAGFSKDIADNVVNAKWVSVMKPSVQITVATSGTWRVLLATSAFVVYTNDAVDFTANVPKVVETKQLPGFRYSSYLSLIDKWGYPSIRTPVYFSSPAVDPDPTEVDTNSYGVAEMGVLDTDTVHVFVSNAFSGYYDCDVKLDFRRDANVFLLKSPNDPCPSR